MSPDEKQVLKDFLIDIDSLKQLDKWTSRVNLFDVLRITDNEIRHSNILAWLLDPNESHGLGDSFLRGFISGIAVSLEPQDQKVDVLKFLMQDYYSFQIHREYKNMDLIISSEKEKTAVIVENKIWASESKNQLKKYYERSRTEFPDYLILYVFLTPDGREASDPEWISLSYEEVLLALETAARGKNLDESVKVIVQDYILTVRRSILKETDNELKAICNKIYNDHKAALRLIFENVGIDNSFETEVICSTLQRLSEEGTIIYNNDLKRQFFTAAMDEFLPPLDSADSSWGTKWVYYYWFERNDDKLIIHFEIGAWGLSGEESLKARSLITAAKKSPKFVRYKRLYRKDVRLKEDDYEESLQKAVGSLVRSALENEKKLLSEARVIYAAKLQEAQDNCITIDQSVSQ